MPIIIRPERPTDWGAIHSVNRAAFGGDAEAKLVDALREENFATVSLVALNQDEVVGHILFSPLTITTPTATLPAPSLAPMAVLPAQQRQGIGSLLIPEGLAICKTLGHRIVLVLGHPEYYMKFGFNSELAQPLCSPLWRWLCLDGTGA